MRQRRRAKGIQVMAEAVKQFDLEIREMLREARLRNLERRLEEVERIAGLRLDEIARQLGQLTGR